MINFLELGCAINSCLVLFLERIEDKLEYYKKRKEALENQKAVDDDTYKTILNELIKNCGINLTVYNERESNKNSNTVIDLSRQQ